MAKISNENETKLDLKKPKNDEKENRNDKNVQPTKPMKSKENETKYKREDSIKMNDKSSIIQETEATLQSKKNGKYKSAIMKNSSKDCCQKPLKMIPNVSLTTCKEKFQNAMSTEEENSKISLTETSHRLLSIAAIKLDETPSSDSYTFSPLIKRFNRSDAFLSLALTKDKEDKEIVKERFMKDADDEDSESTEKMFPDNVGRKNNANDKKEFSDYVRDKKIVQSLKTKIKNILENDQMLVIRKLESISNLKRTIIKQSKLRKALQIQTNRKSIKKDVYERVSKVSSYDIEGYALSKDFLTNRRPLFPKMRNSVNVKRAESMSKETINSALSTFEPSDKIRIFHSKENVMNLFPKLFKKISQFHLKPQQVIFGKELKIENSQLYVTEIMKVTQLRSVLIFRKNDYANSTSFQCMDEDNIFPPEFITVTIILTKANENQKVVAKRKQKYKYGYCKTFELFVVINGYLSSYPLYFNASAHLYNNFSFSLSLKYQTDVSYINKNKNDRILLPSPFTPSIRKKSLKILTNKRVRFISLIEFNVIQQSFCEEEQEIDEINLKVKKFRNKFYSSYLEISTLNVLTSPFTIESGYKSLMLKRKMKEKKSAKQSTKKNLSSIQKLLIPIEKVERLKIPEVIVSHCDFEEFIINSQEELHETTHKRDLENDTPSYRKHISPKHEIPVFENGNKIIEKINKSLKIHEFKLPNSFNSHFCEICNKRFEMKIQLRKHFRTHKKQNPSMFKPGSKDLISKILSTINYNNL